MNLLKNLLNLPSQTLNVMKWSHFCALPSSPWGACTMPCLTQHNGQVLDHSGVQKCLSIWFTNSRTGLSKAVNFLEWALTLDIKCQLWGPRSPRVSFSRDIANCCRLCIEKPESLPKFRQVAPLQDTHGSPFLGLPGEVVAPVLVCNKPKSWSFLTVMA